MDTFTLVEQTNRISKFEITTKQPDIIATLTKELEYGLKEPITCSETGYRCYITVDWAFYNVTTKLLHIVVTSIALPTEGM